MARPRRANDGVSEQPQQAYPKGQPMLTVLLTLALFAALSYLYISAAHQ